VRKDVCVEHAGRKVHHLVLRMMNACVLDSVRPGVVGVWQSVRTVVRRTATYESAGNLWTVDCGLKLIHQPTRNPSG